MPKITRAFIKTGMFYFLASMMLGILLEIDSLSHPVLIPLFWHTLMVGWITQIIFGVSLWMFPGRTREESFKAQLWGWLTYFFLNIGLGLRILAEPMMSYSTIAIWKIIVIGSAVLQVIGGLIYIIEMWPRVQSKKQRLQKRKKKSS